MLRCILKVYQLLTKNKTNNKDSSISQIIPSSTKRTSCLVIQAKALALGFIWIHLEVR